ncbi:MAG: hypothetical protein EOP35_01270 [Rubrivivax sp.]|nr:MAG: hypothetical protein EOP35_01270 [Rubrivivax sp.]
MFGTLAVSSRKRAPPLRGLGRREAVGLRVQDGHEVDGVLSCQRGWSGAPEWGALLQIGAVRGGQIVEDLHLSAQVGYQRARGRRGSRSDEAGSRIPWQEQALSLTPVEIRLLRQLLQHPGRIFERAQLLDLIHEDFRDVSDRVVDSHVKNMCRKLATLDLPQECIASVYAASDTGSIRTDAVCCKQRCIFAIGSFRLSGGPIATADGIVYR